MGKSCQLFCLLQREHCIKSFICLFQQQDSWEDEDEVEEKKDEEKVETPKAKPKKTLQQKIAEKEVIPTCNAPCLVLIVRSSLTEYLTSSNMNLF